MSENKKIENPSPEIKDEALDQVAGGADGAEMVPFYCKDCNETSYWPAFVVGSRTKGMRCVYCNCYHTYKVES